MFRLTISLATTLVALAGVNIYGIISFGADLYSHLCYIILDLLYLGLSFQLLLLAYCLARRPPARWRTALANGFLVLATLLVLLSMTDLYLIAFQCDTSGFGGIRSFTHGNWHKHYARHNQLGYWDRDVAQYLDESRSRQELMIAALGDSWTWGQGLPGRKYRYGDILEAELKGKAPLPVAVLNFGRAGADTNVERKMLDDVARVRPDVVLIGYLANDIDRYSNYTLRPIAIGPLEQRLTQLSPTLNYLYWRLRAPRLFAGIGREWADGVCAAYQDPTTMSQHLADIEALIARVRELKARPIFVILPYGAIWQDEPGSSHSRRALRNQVYEILTKKVESLGVPVIGAYRIEDEMTIQQFSVNPMDAHPGKAAHRRMAEVIRDELLSRDLLQK